MAETVWLVAILENGNRIEWDTPLIWATTALFAATGETANDKSPLLCIDVYLKNGLRMCLSYVDADELRRQWPESSVDVPPPKECFYRVSEVRWYRGDVPSWMRNQQ